ncbi:small nuclear ribonucleoprotein polypeptide A' [Capsaspora owczarzaki ATCC 30864]|uniref:Small nuclear ribonucleoprotein polypeptide A n=1 Tax=Capsaspora owczarzaki (strain ATCC 30864) TaxID=595528 RepID=A0A0D2WJX0_CAPO3|nr:small nuclear ribonucleoprotein polypeptide A' [Capsaspora owczarzaki ATCC 30864]KJE89768.1 small nuclear ribonucleoprotein polypeptide A' [Capsaspora owczarzaki ATCC 30864]|eukprot:XP_004349694.1 small nuclear ribonucleoprotein polypeptide A' [Capsaspora owczarzaki ATCC 30864]
MKISEDLINASAQFVNPLKDRELDMRRNAIEIIENLGTTNDQFDTIDLSDNLIRKIDGFPQFKRLKTLLLNNNRVSKIASDLHQSLPNLEELALIGNSLQELGDIEPLKFFPKLRRLVLLQNNITTSSPQYRSYVIYKLPQLTVLDFQKIKKKEREVAAKAFAGDKGKSFEAQHVKTSKTFVPGEMDSRSEYGGGVMRTEEQKQAIQHAVANAQSLEEVQRLEALLLAGQVPNPGESVQQWIARATGRSLPTEGGQVVEHDDD